MFARPRRRARADSPDKTDNPERKQPPNRQALARLLRLAAPYWRQLVISAVCLVITSLLTLAFPIIITRIVDSANSKGDASTITNFALILIGIFVVQFIFNFGQSYLLSYTGERLVADLRKNLYAHLQSLSLSFYDNQRVGELTSRLSNDVTVVQSGLTNNLIAPIGQLLTLIGGLVIIVLIDWKLIIVILLVVPPVAIIGSVFGRRLRNVSEQTQAALGLATTVLEETLAAPRIVKAFGREQYEIGRYQGAVETSFQLGMRRALSRSFFIALITLVTFSALVGIMWFGGMEVLNGTLSAGQLLSLPIYVLVAVGPIASLSGVYASFQEASGAAIRLFGILDTNAEIADAPDAIALPQPARGDIEFRDITFHYQDGPDVLHNLSLSVHPGEVLALVGPSGAGKTTLAGLIPRFYEVQGGALLVDGYDVRSLKVDSLRGEISIVPQDPQLFGGTIYENIAYGRLDASEQDIHAAARAANAHTFITELQGGYNSLIGERGVKLSGGQKQRVAIARALLRNPRILILDEATSSLDNESEALVKQALERLMRGRTVVIIAHRLSTVEKADRIAVIEGGKVAELGTHSELLAFEGLYHRLYTRSAAGLPLEELPPSNDLEELATREVAGTSS
ncbi:MAG: ABC transporter ATP-binding protein [Chloroflexia bacterium]